MSPFWKGNILAGQQLLRIDRDGEAVAQDYDLFWGAAAVRNQPTGWL